MITAPGVYHGTLNYENSDDFIDGAQLLPHPQTLEAPTSPGHDRPPSTEIPMAISLTEFHFVLLYKGHVAGICNLDEKLTYEEVIPLVSFATPIQSRNYLKCFNATQKPNEEVLGLTADPVRKTYWVYTNQSIFELRVDNESRDVWKIYLQQERHDIALRYAKVSFPTFQFILSETDKYNL